MPSLYRTGGCHSVNIHCSIGVKSLFVNQRNVQPLSVSPCRRFRRWLTNSAVMQQKEISIGWAMTRPDVSAALDRVLASIRSLSDKSKTWLDARSNYFPPFSLPFGRKVLPLHRSNNGGYIHSVGHRLIVQQYCRAFFMPSLYRYRRLPFRKYTIARWVKSLLFDQRDVQPLSVSPRRRFRQRSNNSAIMQKQEISIGWAMPRPDVTAALDRVLANIRSLSDKSSRWLDARSNYFPPFSLPFGRKVLPLPMLNRQWLYPLRWTSVNCPAILQGFFYALIISYRRLPSRKYTIAQRVKSLFVKQRDVQPLSVSPCRRFRRCLTNSAIMRQKEISIGWAMTQPNAAAALDRVLANIRSLSDKSKTWLDARNETFTALCGTEGDTFTRRDVVRAHLYLIGVFVIMCVANWLEGGAS